MTAVRSKNDVLAELVPLADQRIVDVGSGSGELVRWMAARGADAVGIECGEYGLSAAVAADPDHPERYLDGVGQALPLEDESADAVTFCYSLHHVPEDEMTNALREAHRVLRRDGLLYVIEPVPQGPGFEVARLVDDETYVRGMAQDALTEAEAIGFTAVSAMQFESEYSYANAEAWEANVVGIDPTRAARMEEHRDEVKRRFYDHGSEVPHGWSFRQLNDVKLYRKR